MSTLAMQRAHTPPSRPPQPCGRASAASISLGLHALAVVALAGVWHVDKPAAPPPAISARLVLAPQPTVAATAEPSPPAPAAATPQPLPPAPAVATPEPLPPAPVAQTRATAPPPAAQRTPVRRTATPERPPAAPAPQVIAPHNAEAASAATESAPSAPTSASTSDRVQGESTNATSRPHLPIEKQTPDYPQRALDTGLEGDCTLEYAVTPDGRTENPHVVGDCHPLFIRPSLRAVRGFRYAPRIVDGEAVTVPAVRNTFHFRIER